MHRIRLDIDAAVLENLLEQHALSIDQFNSVDDLGKKSIRAMFLKAAANRVRRFRTQDSLERS